MSQSGHPSRTRLRAGRIAAILVAGCALAVLAEYVSGRSFGLDQLWFGRQYARFSHRGRGVQARKPPSRSCCRHPESLSPTANIGGGFIPVVSLAAYLFGATPLVFVKASTGMALTTSAVRACRAMTPTRVTSMTRRRSGRWAALPAVLALAGCHSTSTPNPTSMAPPAPMVNTAGALFYAKGGSLYVSEPAGSPGRKLTDGPFDTQPAPSPHVAFVRKTKADDYGGEL